MILITGSKTLNVRMDIMTAASLSDGPISPDNLCNLIFLAYLTLDAAAVPAGSNGLGKRSHTTSRGRHDLSRNLCSGSCTDLSPLMQCAIGGYFLEFVTSSSRGASGSSNPHGSSVSSAIN